MVLTGIGTTEMSEDNWACVCVLTVFTCALLMIGSNIHHTVACDWCYKKVVKHQEHRQHETDLKV